MPLNLREKNKARHEIENKIHFYWYSCTPIPAPLIFLSTIAHINICKLFLSILFCHLSRPLLYNTIKNIYKHNFVTGALCCYKDSIDASLSIGQCTFIQGRETLVCCSVTASSESRQVGPACQVDPVVLQILLQANRPNGQSFTSVGYSRLVLLILTGPWEKVHGSFVVWSYHLIQRRQQ